MNSSSVLFNDIITALCDEQKPFPPQYLHRFTDLHGEELESLKNIWHVISKTRKTNLLVDLIDLAAAETLVCFDEIGKIAVYDPETTTRILGVHLLAISEDFHIIPVLINLMKNDPDVEMRASATRALGRFVYMGEVEDISEEKYGTIMDALLEVMDKNEEPLVQRKALESAGYSSRKEISKLIDQANKDPDPEWKVSAVIAMGLSADEKWSSEILKCISSPAPDLQTAAITAAGELELRDAQKPILGLLQAGIDDFDTRSAAINALARIGGEGVRDTLEELLEKAEDEDEALLIENALDELEFTESFPTDKMFEFDIQDEDELDTIMDIESESDEDET